MAQNLSKSMELVNVFDDLRADVGRIVLRADSGEQADLLLDSPPH